MSLKVYIPIDIDVEDKDYVIPTIENQKDDLVAAINSSTDIADQSLDLQDYGKLPPQYQQLLPSNQATESDAASEITKRINHFTYTDNTSWLEAESFEHNCVNYGKSERTSQFGEFSIGKGVTNSTPTSSYLCMNGLLIPHVIIRQYCKYQTKSSPRILSIVEYELHYCNLSGASNNGAHGGNNESINIIPKVVISKYIRLNLDSGDFDTYEMSRWDMVKKKGSKTIYKNRFNKQLTGSNTTLLELAKKSLLQNIDAQHPDDINTLKKLGILSNYEIIDDDPVEIESEEEYDGYN